MRFLYLTLTLFALSLTGCDDKPVTINNSGGRINDILIVMETTDWEGTVGDTIRNVLAQPLLGIVREEPLFSLTHTKPKFFEGMVKKSRNYLTIKKADTTGIGIVRNRHARPQLGVIAVGPDAASVAQIISDNRKKIIDAYTRQEINHKQNLIHNVPLDTKLMDKSFGIDIAIPTAYRYAKMEETEPFFWLRRDIPEGTMDLMFYEVDRNRIRKETTTINQIIRIRDSIGQLKIPVRGGGSFITERMFTPFLNETQVNGVFAYETRGTWEVKEKFMAGPFINYAIYNKEKDNWLVAEGYVSAPNSEQRDYLFEIEAIMKSIRFTDQ